MNTTIKILENPKFLEKMNFLITKFLEKNDKLVIRRKTMPGQKQNLACVVEPGVITLLEARESGQKMSCLDLKKAEFTINKHQSNDVSNFVSICQRLFEDIVVGQAVVFDR